MSTNLTKDESRGMLGTGLVLVVAGLVMIAGGVAIFIKNPAEWPLGLVFVIAGFGVFGVGVLLLRGRNKK